jgi:hypothetical protein
METQANGAWQVKLVSRTSRTEIEGLLRGSGVRTVCHDQNPDGSGGAIITVDELLAEWVL